jgi:hypothetical protein
MFILAVEFQRTHQLLDSHPVAFLKRQLIVRIRKKNVPSAALKKRDVILDMNCRAVLNDLSFPLQHPHPPVGQLTGAL